MSMSRPLIFAVMLFAAASSHAQVIVSPGPPSNPGDWIRFNLDLDENEWFHGSFAHVEPGLDSVSANIQTSPSGGESTTVVDDTFWIGRSLTGNPRLSFNFFLNERGGNEHNLYGLLIGPEIDAGHAEYTLTVGPITSLEWFAQSSRTRRMFTIAGPGGYSRVIPEPSTWAIMTAAVLASLGASRRRR